MACEQGNVAESLLLPVVRRVVGKATDTLVHSCHPLVGHRRRPPQAQAPPGGRAVLTDALSAFFAVFTQDSVSSLLLRHLFQDPNQASIRQSL